MSVMGWLQRHGAEEAWHHGPIYVYVLRCGVPEGVSSLAIDAGGVLMLPAVEGPPQAACAPGAGPAGWPTPMSNDATGSGYCGHGPVKRPGLKLPGAARLAGEARI